MEGNETALQAIVIAYGMEEGARRFYDRMSVEMPEDEPRRVFADLARAEEGHKERLWAAYSTLPGADPSREGLEREAEPRAVEGGRSAQELLDEYRKEPRLPKRGTQALEFAIALEIDSLDLYLRMARASQEDAARRVFHDLADEEKRHLESLGRALGAVYRPNALPRGDPNADA